MAENNIPNNPHPSEGQPFASQPLCLSTFTRWDEPHLQVTLGPRDAAYFSGILGGAEDDPNAMTFLSLYVDRPYRLQGVAYRLVSGLARAAMDRGATTMYGSVESQHTLKIFSKMFGDSRLAYSDIDPVSQKEVPLPITTGQAIQSLERAERYEADLEDRLHGIVTTVGLTGFDPAQFESPVHCTQA